MKNLIFVFACLFSVSVFGQNNDQNILKTKFENLKCLHFNSIYEGDKIDMNFSSMFTYTDEDYEITISKEFYNNRKLKTLTISMDNWTYVYYKNYNTQGTLVQSEQMNKGFFYIELNKESLISCELVSIKIGGNQEYISTFGVCESE